MFTMRFFLLFCCAAWFTVDAFQVTSSPWQARPAQTALQAERRTNEPVLDRRKALASSGIALVSLLLGGNNANAETPQTIVITGCNSGIGFEATKILADKGHTIVMACRTLQKAQDAATRVKESTTAGTLIPAECNLASLSSIDSFARDLKLENLDVVCFNAGLALNTEDKQIQRTSEGFELTGRFPLCVCDWQCRQIIPRELISNRVS
jgi:hypothetical protein